MKTIKLSTLFFAVSAIAFCLAVHSATAADYPEWLPVRDNQQMQQPVNNIPSGATWIATYDITLPCDNMGNPATRRISIAPGTKYMYFNTMYSFYFVLKGNGRQADALSSNTAGFFDATVLTLDISSLIESDGCVEMTVRYAGQKTGQFIAAGARYAMFR